MYKAVVLIVIAVFTVAGIVYYTFEEHDPFGPQPGAKIMDVTKKWDMPNSLDEISGIAWMGNHRVASIQDEDGIIFIYNLKDSKVEKKIKFTGKGDFEGVALVGKDAYVLRSDGVIFEVDNFMNFSGNTIKHKTSLAGKFNFEGICYDKDHNRLLLSIKDKDGDKFKPIFAFDLAYKVLNKTPVYKIYFNDPIFSVLKHKDSPSIIRPSEISINPKNKNLYILEGQNPKLLILSPQGKAQRLYVMEEKQFAQAEGLTFGANNELYISNESNGAPANIMRVNLN